MVNRLVSDMRSEIAGMLNALFTEIQPVAERILSTGQTTAQELDTIIQAIRAHTQLEDLPPEVRRAFDEALEQGRESALKELQEEHRLIAPLPSTDPDETGGRNG